MTNSKEKIINILAASRLSKERDIKEMDNLRQRVEDLEKKAKRLDFSLDIAKVVIIGVIVVFFVSFLVFILDAYRFHANTYNEYKESVEFLKNEIQIEKEKNIRLRLDQLEEELN